MTLGIFAGKFSERGLILHEGEFFTWKCAGGCLGRIVWMSVWIRMQNYKSHVYAPPWLTHTQTDRFSSVIYYELSAKLIALRQ